MGILELLRRQAYGPVFEAFLYDKKNLIKLRDSMLIDSYYSGILLMGKNIVTSMESLPADVAVQEQCRLFTAVAAAHIEASCSLRVVPVALSWGLPMEWLDNHASIERMDAWPCFHLIQDAMQITWALLVACDRCLPWTVVHEQLARVFPCEFIECISPFYGFIRRNARMFSKIVRPQALDRMDEMQAILLRV